MAEQQSLFDQEQAPEYQLYFRCQKGRTLIPPEGDNCDKCRVCRQFAMHQGEIEKEGGR